jgi:RHS repeat-associated protein
MSDLVVNLLLQFRRRNSPYINHFIQPDAIVPNPSNPQSWNRYSYVRNNPVLYNDPTGHREDLGNLGNQRSVDCRNNPQYCKSGKPKSKEELKKMRNEGNRNKPILTSSVTPLATTPLPTVTPTMDLHLPAQCTSYTPCLQNFIPSATPSSASTPYNVLATAVANLDIAANTAIAGGVNYCLDNPEPPCGKTAEQAVPQLEPWGTVFDAGVGTANSINNSNGGRPPTQQEKIVLYAADALAIPSAVIPLLIFFFAP